MLYDTDEVSCPQITYNSFTFIQWLMMWLLLIMIIIDCLTFHRSTYVSLPLTNIQNSIVYLLQSYHDNH